MKELDLTFGATYFIQGKAFRLQTFGVSEGENGQSVSLQLLDETLFNEVVASKASTKAQRDYFVRLPDLIAKTTRLHDHFIKEIDEEEKWKS